MQMYKDFMAGEVFKSTYIGDCTNGGASSKYSQLYVVAEHVTITDVIEYCSEHNEDINRFFKVDYDFYNSHNYIRIQPITKGNKWYVMGGNFIHSCDSRFKKFVCDCSYPVPIHDRCEF